MNFSTACLRNRDPILAVLRKILRPAVRRVLEIGSGTGQHAIYFAPALPHLEWFTSDMPTHHPGLQESLRAEPSTNLHGPLRFTIGQDPFPPGTWDAVFLANVLHIVSIQVVNQLIHHLGQALAPGAQVIFYGPFNYAGKFTSTSNQAFDAFLRERYPGAGRIKDFEAIADAMGAAGLRLVKDHALPANNRLLHFVRS